jgi:hypothetical protein
MLIWTPDKDLAQCVRGDRVLQAAEPVRPIESFPEDVLGNQREAAKLFKRLAILHTDSELFSDVEELRWRGPTPARAQSPSAGRPTYVFCRFTGSCAGRRQD